MVLPVNNLKLESGVEDVASWVVGMIKPLFFIHYKKTMSETASGRTI